MTSRPALLAVFALSLAWITTATVYLYPGVKEEVDEKRYLHRVEKLHAPVLPLECGHFSKFAASVASKGLPFPKLWAMGGCQGPAIGWPTPRGSLSPWIALATRLRS